MKKLLKWLFRFLLIGLLIVCGIIAFHSFNFNSVQRKVEAVTAVKIDQQAIHRLSKAVQIPTTSYETHIDTAAFLDFLSFVKQNYPLCDSLLNFYTIHDYSFVYHWPGNKPALAPVLLMAHIDVVPMEAASTALWTLPPIAAAWLTDSSGGAAPLMTRSIFWQLWKFLRLCWWRDISPSVVFTWPVGTTKKSVD